MFFVFLFLGFKIHKIIEAKPPLFSDKLNKVQGGTNKKSIKAEGGCDFKDYPHDDWWNFHGDSSAPVPYVDCQGSEGNLQNIVIQGFYAITGIKRAGYDENGYGLIHVVNANFNMDITEVHQFVGHGKFAQFLYFDGGGQHVITGTKMKYCGMSTQNNEDVSVICIKGTSTNIFSSIWMHHPTNDPRGFALSSIPNEPPLNFPECKSTRGILVTDSATLTLRNSRFFNNTAIKYGGALMSDEDAIMNVQDTIIDTCTDLSTSHVNGIYCYSSALNTIERCQFIECAAPGLYGGVVWVSTNLLNFRDNTIEFFDILQSCCGLYMDYKGTFEITGNTFIKCGYNGRKHAILYLGGRDAEEHVTFSDNTFDGCDCKEDGRAISASFLTVNQFDRITVKNTPPGLITIHLKFPVQKNDNFTFSNCLFESNHQTADNVYGGGSGLVIQNVQNDGSAANEISVVINNCRFNGNSAYRGGGIQFGSTWFYKTNVYIIDSTFENNYAEQGGAISIQTTKKCIITGCHFTGNKGTAECGCIFIETDTIPAEKLKKIEIYSCDFQGNSGMFSHCIYVIDGSETVLELSSNKFNGNYNKAMDSLNLFGACILSNCKELNSLSDKFENSNPAQSCGGINITSKSILKVESSVFKGCNAGTKSNSYGGGIGYKVIVNKDASRTESITIHSCVFENNAGNNGVSLCLYPSTYPNLDSNIFQNHNYSKKILVIEFQMETDDYEYVLKDLKFIGNICNNKPDDTQAGGAGIWIAESSSGGDWWLALNLAFENCLFQKNYAPSNGGAFAYYGSESLMAVSLHFRKCIFEHNSCGGRYGGACQFSTNKNVTILECTFNNNSATGQGSGGGAILLGNSLRIFTIYKTTFTQCRGEQGAFIYSLGALSEVNVSYCDFSDIDDDQKNSLDFKISSTNTLFIFEWNTFTGLCCSGSNGATGIHITSDRDIEIANCQFSSNANKNTSDEDENGQITILDNSAFVITFYNCTFNDVKGTTTQSGRALQVSGESNIRVDSCRFENFLYNRRTGQALNSKSTTTSTSFYNCTFENIRGSSAIHYQFVKSVSLSDCYFRHVNCGGHKGLLFNDNAKEFKIYACLFDDCGNSNDNYNPLFYGGVLTMGDSVEVGEVINCSFKNCWTLGRTCDGGCIRCAWYDSYVLEVFGCSFDNCTIANRGTCIFVEHKAQEVKIYNNIFRNNYHKESDTGIIYCRSPTLFFNNNTFEGNNIRALMISDLSTHYSELKYEIINNVFKGNTAIGTLFYENTNGNYNDNLIIENNTFDGIGGGNCRAFKILSQKKLLFRNNTIQNCPIENLSEDYIGWLRAGTTIFVDSCQFLNNGAQAKHGGGAGLWFTKSDGSVPNIEFNNCIFKGNRANHSMLYEGQNTQVGLGGAIQIGGSSSSLKNSVVGIYNCIFENNVADREGGAVSLQVNSKGNIIENCTFINNKAGSQNYGNSTQNYKMGGGLYIHSDDVKGETIVTGCVFKSNKGGNNGHALYCESNGTVTVTGNCVFTDNINQGGSQVVVSGKNFILTNVTISLSDYTGGSTKARAVEIIPGGSISVYNITFKNTQAQDNDGNAIMIRNGAVKANIENATFLDCGNSGYAVSVYSSTINFVNNKFDFTSTSVSCGCIALNTRGSSLLIERNTFKKAKVSALKYNDNRDGTTPNLIIDSNIFTECVGALSCYNIISYHDFKFINNYIQNNFPPAGTYLGSIDFKLSMTSKTYTFSGNKFINNTCSSEFGGGCGFWIVNKDGNNVPQNNFTMNFENCYFENNHAVDGGAASQGGYKGHGGALQLGWTFSMSSIILVFTNCQFIKNKADKQGGALSIETVFPVEITGCTFDGNTAGNSVTGGDAYLYQCGGALYVEPDFNNVNGHFNDLNLYMNSLKITKTLFQNNKAMNATAIYIKSGKYTTISLSDNCQFLNNGNESSAFICRSNMLNIKNSIFKCTSVQNRGLESYSKTSLDNVEFNNNKYWPDGLGQALYIGKDSGETQVTNCKFINCGNGGENFATIRIETEPFRFEKNLCQYSDKDNACKALLIKTFGHMEVLNNSFIYSNAEGALQYIPEYGSPENESVIVENNIFDHMFGWNTRAFHILAKSKNVLFRKNTIQNCEDQAKSYLGQINLVGLDSFTFDSCIFRNLNTSSAFGGGTGVWVKNDRRYDLIYENCIFENCHSVHSQVEKECPNGLGGALQYGWSDSISDCNVKLRGCLFKDNKADRDGGAVCLMVQGNIEIENCSFINNVAGLMAGEEKFNGGALAIYPSFGYKQNEVSDSVNIYNCTFIGNHGNDIRTDANGIYVQNAPKTAIHITDNCIFTDNVIDPSFGKSVILVEAKELDISKAVFIFSNFSISTRAIESNATTVSLLSNKFSNCSHSNGQGNAVFVTQPTSSFIAESCIFTDNGLKGSVIETRSKEFTLDMSTINFTNQAVSSRGIFAQYGCKFYLLDSYFNKCKVEGGASGASFEYQGDSMTGYSEEINILGCTFDDNTCSYASAFKISTKVIPSIKDIVIKNHKRGSFIVVIFFLETIRKEFIADHWTFENNFYNNNENSKDCGGSGIWIAPMKTNPGFRDSWPLTFDSCTWRNNHAAYVGGAFAYGNSNTLRYIYVNITHCIFENNYCDQEGGGALWFNNQNPVKINDCTFTGNYAGGNNKGHALYISERCTAVVTDSKFIDNGNTSTLSVVHVSGTQIDFLRSDISFTNSSVGCRAICIDYPTIANFVNSTFRQCSAGSQPGGGIYFNNKDFTADEVFAEEISVEGCTFDGTLGSNGCAIYFNMSSVPVLKRNTIINQPRGTFILSIFFTSFKDECVVESCTFQNCFHSDSEDGGGSGIWIANKEEISNGRPAELLFSKCVWQNNTTPNRGGALYYGNSKTLYGMELTFDKCTFINNQASKEAGAVFLNQRAPCVFNECKFESNIVKPAGSAKTRACSIMLAAKMPLVQIKGCQFTNETADDGNAIYILNVVPACFISGCTFKNCGTSGTVVVSESPELLFQNTDVEFTTTNKACRGLDIRTISVTTITKSKFIKCKAGGENGGVKEGRGGGIYLDNELGSEDQEDFTLEDCTFDACIAANGCAVLLKTRSLASIRGNVIQNHKSGNYVFCVFNNVNFLDVITLESCSFVNNMFPNDDLRDGGGCGLWISNDQNLLPGTPTKLVFSGCTWSKNTASYGGALSYGTSPTLKNTEIVFEKCTFDTNTANGEFGGAIYLTTYQPILIEGCTFKGNKALSSVDSSKIAYGGALYFDSNATLITITGSTFKGNSAQNGNAIWSSKMCQYVDISGCELTSNSNGQVGSQIAHSGVEIHVTDTKIQYETTTKKSRGIEVLSKSKSYFKGCTFYLCEANGVGGGLHVQDTLSSTNVEMLTIDGCTFDSCHASNGAALLCDIKCNPTINRVTIKNINKGSYIFVFFFSEFQEFVTLDECTFLNNYYPNSVGSPDGGGAGFWIATKKELYNGTSSKLTLNKCKFVGNKAAAYGGAIAYGKSNTLNSTFLQFKECTFENNTCDGSEGGALWITTEAPTLISGCSFANNKANGLNNRGSHIYIDSPSEYCQIYNSKFSNGQAGEGNAIFSLTRTISLQIYGCNFTNCGASGSVIVSNAREIKLSASIISFSTNENAARGLEIKQKQLTTINGVQFINCKSTGNGGGVFIDFSSGSNNESLAITDCTFDNDTSTGGNAVWATNLHSYPAIKGDTIKNCQNQKYIFVFMFETFVDKMDIENCIFENNKYNNNFFPSDAGGSGIWIANMKTQTIVSEIYQTFKGCTFSYNEASGVGGAFSLGQSGSTKNTVLTFEGCSFIQNRAGTEGGALCLTTVQHVIISNCKFDGNIAGTNGGALFIDPQAAVNVTIQYSQFARNTGEKSGAGLYIINKDIFTLYNNTLVENKAKSDAHTLFIKNEGTTASINKNNFDFVRETDQYQIQLSGSAEGSINVKDCCFTHKGTSDETLTHIKSDTNSAVNIQSGNCFDTKDSLSISHSGSGKLSTANGIFNCNKCDDVFIPTMAPEPTPKPTSLPINYTSVEETTTSSIIQTSVPQTNEDDNQANKGNKSAKTIGMIAGVVVAAVVIIVIIVILLWLFVCRNRSTAPGHSDSGNASEMNDETISGITGLDNTADDPIWAGATSTADNPLFNGGEEHDDDEANIIQNNFEENWGENVI